MIQPGNCKHCGSDSHTSLMCFQKARAPIKKVSNKTKQKDAQMRREWFKRPENAPNVNMQWTCYLKISPECDIFVTKETLNLEHVRSKVRSPELKFDPDNIKPSCRFCNQKKQSRDIEDLVEEYPHLRVYLDK